MVVRMRHTRSHTANRRSHHALKAPNLATCSNCGAKHRPHHMCQGCGFYNERMVVDMVAKKNSREARLQAKKEARGVGETAPSEELKEEVKAGKTKVSKEAK